LFVSFFHIYNTHTQTHSKSVHTHIDRHKHTRKKKKERKKEKKTHEIINQPQNVHVNPPSILISVVNCVASSIVVSLI